MVLEQLIYVERKKKNTDSNLTLYISVYFKADYRFTRVKYNSVNLEDRKKSSGSKDRKVFLEITNA